MLYRERHAFCGPDDRSPANGGLFRPEKSIVTRDIPYQSIIDGGKNEAVARFDVLDRIQIAIPLLRTAKGMDTTREEGRVPGILRQ